MKRTYISLLTNATLLFGALFQPNAFAQTCIDPDLSKISTETQITLCNGQTVSGTMTIASKAKCTRSGQTGCITTATIPAGDTTKLTPQDVQLGKSLGGLTGKMRATKVCKNGLGKYGASAVVPWDGSGGGGGGAVTINNGSTTITLTASNFEWLVGIGDQVTIAGETRTVASVTSTTVIDVSVPFTTSAAGVAGWTVKPSASFGYPMSDRQNGGTYTGEGRTNCNENNFSDVTTTASPHKPSGDAAWTHIYRDELTGIHVTNLLHAGLTLAEAAARCEALNGYGTGGTGWRLPTEKEVVQLHIDGAFFVLGNIGRVRHSTTYTNNPFWSVLISMGDTSMAGPYGRGTNHPVICLRE